MEEVEQIKLDIPNEIRPAKPLTSSSKNDERIKKLEIALELLTKKVDVLYKAIKR